MSDQEDDFTGVVNATPTIICFENGKTWECPECGGGIGTALDTPTVRCSTCNANLADHDASTREPREWDRDGDGRPIGLETARTADMDAAETTDEGETDAASDAAQTSALEW